MRGDLILQLLYFKKYYQLELSTQLLAKLLVLCAGLEVLSLIGKGGLSGLLAVLAGYLYRFQ